MWNLQAKRNPEKDKEAEVEAGVEGIPKGTEGVILHLLTPQVLIHPLPVQVPPFPHLHL